MHRAAVGIALVVALVAAGCGDDSAESREVPGVDGGGGADARGDVVGAGGFTDATGAVSCDLGTMYPDAGVIDPDAPVYEDTNWTQAEVTTAFADAKAQNDSAYRAYRAARELGELLECAFCACGCAPTIGHLSAIDCFKDMHGFA